MAQEPITVLLETSGLPVALVLDAVKQETYSGEVELTRYPVERGMPVTDTFRPQPRPLEVSGLVSSFPLTRDEAAGLDRLTRLLELLQNLVVSAELCTVSTPLQVREHMHLKTYRATHSTAGLLSVTLNFDEVRIVEAQRVKVVLPKKAPDRTKPGAADGKQVVAPASDEAQRRSLFKHGVRAIFGKKE